MTVLQNILGIYLKFIQLNHCVASNIYLPLTAELVHFFVGAMHECSNISFSQTVNDIYHTAVLQH
jgi:hypothetical protein